MTLYLLHLKAPITERSIARLSAFLSPHSASALSFNAFIPESSLVLLAPSSLAFVSAVEAAPGVLLVDVLLPEDKFSPSLLSDDGRGNSAPGIEWMVHLYEGAGVDLDALMMSLVPAIQAVAPRAQLTSVGARYLHLRVPTRTVSGAVRSALLDILSSSPFVVLVLPRAVHTVQNRFVRAIVAPPSAPTDRSWLSVHNLTGLGQVIAHSDTGVDYDSCFFADPAHPVVLNSLMPSHRKLLLYSTMGRDDGPLTGDEVDGHGTHTAGSIAGFLLPPSLASLNASAYRNLSAFNGLAHQSRLAVYDFASKGALVVPVDITASFYGPLFSLSGGPHAPIASNSWGSPNGDYDHYCLDTDRFAYEHPTFLALFAAGNYGEEGFHSVSSPGIAKNVVTVGSSQSSRESFVVQGRAVGIRVDGTDWPVLPASFGRPYAQSNFSADVRLVVASPLDACAFNASDASYPLMASAIVLVSRAHCFFSDKARNLERAGAVLMLVEQFDDHPLVVMAANAGDAVSIPSVMISHELGQLLQSLTASPAIAAPIVDVQASSGEDFLSSFSSRGPTYDGRLKPDVVAPGEYVISVRSDGVVSSNTTCPVDPADALNSLEGTSMATPAVAASAALIRQYLMRGEYEGVAFEPTAALVKGLLIHGGVSVRGTVTSRRRQGGSSVEAVEAAPSVYQGYGRIELPSILRFPDDADWQSKSIDLADVNLDAARGRRLPLPKLYQRAEIGASDDARLHHYCYRVQLPPPQSSVVAADFRATLVWTDPPPSVLTSHFLVNDLDLIVVRGDEDDVYLGNGGYNAFAVDGSPPTTHWDIVNNVEQATLSAASLVLFNASTLSVHVRGTSLSSSYSRQAYALVVTGPVVRAGVDECASPLLCPHNCTGRGECVMGSCVCAFPYVAYDCGLAAEPLLYDAETTVWSVSGHVESEGYAWYYFSVPSLSTGLQLTVQRTSTVGDPDVVPVGRRLAHAADARLRQHAVRQLPGHHLLPAVPPLLRAARVVPRAAARLLLRRRGVRADGQPARRGAGGGVGVADARRGLRAVRRGGRGRVGAAVGAQEEGVG